MLAALDAQRSLAHPIYSIQDSGIRNQESRDAQFLTLLHSGFVNQIVEVSP